MTASDLALGKGWNFQRGGNMEQNRKEGKGKITHQMGFAIIKR